MKYDHKQNMKIILILVLTVLCILGVFGLFMSGSADYPKDTSENEASSVPAMKIDGIITEISAEILTVQTAGSKTYSFSIQNIKNLPELSCDSLVAVFYRGSLDEAVPIQNVELTEIILKDSLEKQAFNILKNMTAEEKVGQMFIGRCPEKEAAAKLTEFHLGGYILFKPDFENKTKDEVIQTIKSYQEASVIPLFIGVDEEGGKVNRISLNEKLRKEPFKSSQELYQEGGFDLIKSDTLEKCSLLYELGVNLNFAPVCDLSFDPNDYIYERTFGQDPQSTAEYIRIVVETMKNQKMGSVLKHFPGYGNNEDTHAGIAYDNRSYETFLSADFIPFQAGINAGADAVLVSHNIINSIDSQYPASLSPKIHSILREDLKFDGIIITDDLYMKGVREFANDSDIAVMAVLAGNDLLCCTDFETQIPAVINAVKNGIIPEERVNDSVLRILKVKIVLGIIPFDF